MRKKNSRNTNLNLSVAGETETQENDSTRQKKFPAPVTEELEQDIPTKEVYIFFGTLLALFTVSFLLKYMLPHVPEYIFERLLLLVLAAFCGRTLWKLSPGLREFTYRHTEKFRRKQQ